jgi:hypothetical protein
MAKAVLGSICSILLLATAAHAQSRAEVLKLTYSETTVDTSSQTQSAQTSSRTVVWIVPDGRQRTEIYDSGHHITSATIFDPNTHRVIRLDYSSKTATNIPAAEHALKGMGGVPQDTGGAKESLGVRKILGLECRGTRATSPEGATIEGWGCPDTESGQVIFASLHMTSPNGLEMRRELQEIKRLPQADPALFEVPAGFDTVNITKMNAGQN